METVRTALWVLMAVLLTLFAVANFDEVQVWVFPGYRADTYVSIVVLISFLLGFLPPYLVNKTNSWRMHRKLKQQDETIALLRPTPAPASAEVAPVTPPPLSSTETTA